MKHRIEQLVEAKFSQDDIEKARQSIIAAYHAGDTPVVANTISELARHGFTFEQAVDAVLTDTVGHAVFLSSEYQVVVRDLNPEEKRRGKWWHLSIKRVDRQPIHDWRDLQEIKNQLCGEECEGVEVYPAESRLVDTANQYHLWVCLDPNYRLPFGFSTREVSETRVNGSVQRPFNSK